jgi:hypothetical protein
VGEAADMHGVVDDAEVLLDLAVAGVVPVADAGFLELAEKQVEIAFEGDFLERLAVFDAEFQPALRGFLGEGMEERVGGVHVRFLAGLAFLQGFLEQLLVLGSFLAAFGDHVEEAVGVVLHLDGAHVEDDQDGFEAGGGVEGLEAVLPGVLAFRRSRAVNLKRLGAGCMTPMGRGQKLWRDEILISPASTASMMPGRRPRRMPWLSSAYSKPRERISLSICRPQVWRPEFQHEESEYMENVRIRRAWVERTVKAELGRTRMRLARHPIEQPNPRQKSGRAGGPRSTPGHDPDGQHYRSA